MKFALGTDLNTDNYETYLKIVQVISKKRQIWRMKKCSKKNLFQFCYGILLGMQWSDIIIMYLGVLYFWNIQWWFRLQFPFFSVYFARCKLSYISCSLSLSVSLVEVISDFLMDFACLMTRKAQLMLTVIVINHSLQLTQTSCLAFCLPVCFSFSFVRLLMWFTICQSSHPTRKAFNSLSMDFKTHYDTLQRLGGILTPSG